MISLESFHCVPLCRVSFPQVRERSAVECSADVEAYVTGAAAAPTVHEPDVEHVQLVLFRPPAAAHRPKHSPGAAAADPAAPGLEHRPAASPAPTFFGLEQPGRWFGRERRARAPAAVPVDWQVAHRVAGLACQDAAARHHAERAEYPGSEACLADCDSARRAV